MNKLTRVLSSRQMIIGARQQVMASRGERDIYGSGPQARNYEPSRVADSRRFEDEAPPTEDD